MAHSFNIIVKIEGFDNDSKCVTLKSKRERVRRCIFCDRLFSIDNLHPSHLKICGSTPRWCRECNYYFSSYAKILDVTLLRCIRKAKRNAGKKRICKWCGESFNLLKNFYSIGSFDSGDLITHSVFIPDWLVPKGIDFLYPNLYTEICPSCFRRLFHEKYEESSKKYEEAIKELGLWIGKLPNQDFLKYMYHARSREEVEWFIAILQKLPTPREVKDRFGSFFSLLSKSGLLVDGCRRLRFGTQCIAKDEHVCFSLIEREIDDWLYKHRIYHQKEVLYPNSNMRCDWEVVFHGKRFFIEYFGLMSNEAYAHKVKQKHALALESNINLISIFPHDNWKNLLENIFTNRY